MCGAIRRKKTMTEIEKLALAVALLTADVAQLHEQVDELQRVVNDDRDIFRNCACFGAADSMEPL